MPSDMRLRRLGFIVRNTDSQAVSLSACKGAEPTVETRSLQRHRDLGAVQLRTEVAFRRPCVSGNMQCRTSETRSFQGNRVA